MKESSSLGTNATRGVVILTWDFIQTGRVHIDHL